MIPAYPYSRGIVPRATREEYRLRTKHARRIRNEAIAAAHKERDDLILAVKAKCTEKVQIAKLRYDTERQRVKEQLGA